jgi:hypothetical protein
MVAIQIAEIDVSTTEQMLEPCRRPVCRNGGVDLAPFFERDAQGIKGLWRVWSRRCRPPQQINTVVYMSGFDCDDAKKVQRAVFRRLPFQNLLTKTNSSASLAVSILIACPNQPFINCMHDR